MGKRNLYQQLYCSITVQYRTILNAFHCLYVRVDKAKVHWTRVRYRPPAWGGWSCSACSWSAPPCPWARWPGPPQPGSPTPHHPSQCARLNLILKISRVFNSSILKRKPSQMSWTEITRTVFSISKGELWGPMQWIGPVYTKISS